LAINRSLVRWLDEIWALARWWRVGHGPADVARSGWW